MISILASRSIRRSGLLLTLAVSVGVLAGCKDSPERQQVRQAQAAQQEATIQVENALADMVSPTLAAGQRDKQVIESLEQAEAKLRPVVGQYWPAQAHLGTVLQQKGDIYSALASEKLSTAQRDLIPAMLDLNRLQQVQVFISNWQKRQAVYQAAIDKLKTEQASLEQSRKDLLDQAASLQTKRDSLLKQAQTRRQEAQQVLTEAAKSKSAAEKEIEAAGRDALNEQKRQDALAAFSQALQAERRGGALATESQRLESEAAELAVEIDRLKAVAAVIDARLTMPKAEVSATPAGEAAEGASPAKEQTRSVPGQLAEYKQLSDKADATLKELQAKAKSLRDALQGQVNEIVTAMTASVESANKSAAAYDDAVKMLQNALTRLDQQNRAARQEAPAGQEPPVDLSTELTLRLNLVDANASLAQVKLMIADNKATFQSVSELLSAVGQQAPQPLTDVDFDAAMQAAQERLAKARETLKAIGGSPIVRKSPDAAKWAATVKKRGETLDALAGDGPAVSPSAPTEGEGGAAPAEPTPAEQP